MRENGNEKKMGKFEKMWQVRKESRRTMKKIRRKEASESVVTNV